MFSENKDLERREVDAGRSNEGFGQKKAQGFRLELLSFKLFDQSDYAAAFSVVWWNSAI